MEPEKLLSALHLAEKLKDVRRHCTTSQGRPESVAEHSWRITLMAFLLRDEFPELDMDKVLRMCLIHDLGECFTGDIPAFDKTADPATGTPWKPLSASRQRQRAKKGRSIANMLQDSGLLVGSIARPSGQGAVRDIGPDHALVGTDVPYAAIHQLGGTIKREAAPMTVRLRKWKGRTLFAKTKHKRVRIVDTAHKAYTITIPARPFIGVGPTDIQDMLDTITRNLQKALKP